MGKITLLDQNTINKIAAGEVIERPAAVVKELVENAIDANATAVTVEIKEGGISFIRITDNGGGIPKDDIKTAFLRHATSKIRSVEDLLSVSSLGFRGEALSSIASVSQVELVTKIPNELLGVRYTIEGGEEKSFDEIGCPEGTTFIVRNLFYNTPARRKFLKSATTEAGYIYDLIERLAVSHPNISFKLLNNNQLKLHTSGNNNLKDIIYHVYGRDISANLTKVEASKENLIINGFIGKPIISRGNRNYENYFINGRYIKSPVIMKAIEEAYKPYTMSHRYPFTALHFTIDSSFIDVNVHPTKMEIRFRNADEVYQLTYHTVSEFLKEKELIPEVTIGTETKQPEHEMKKPMPGRGPEPFEHKRLDDYKKIAASNQALKTIQEQEKGTKQSGLSLEELKLFEPVVEGKQASLQPELVIPSVPNETGQPEAVKQPEVLKEATSSFEKKAEQLELFEEKLLSKESVKEHRIIGQLFATYWLIEFKDKLFIIDQHAAHEKVLYEKTMKNLETKQYTSQMLLPPLILSLNPREEEVLKENMDIFSKIGFEVEYFGGKEYQIRAVPADLLGIAQQDLFIELLDTLVEEQGRRRPEIILEKVASMSCKAAVKGNHTLSTKEMESLIDQLMTLDNPYHCPHGRPVIISMSKYEIEKKFKRII